MTVPFLFLAVKRYRQALVQRMRIVRTREGAIASVMQEAIIGIRAVKFSPVRMTRWALQEGELSPRGQRTAR